MSGTALALNLNNIVDIKQVKYQPTNKRSKFEISSVVLKTLLFDNTTKENLMWATDDYTSFGCFFSDKIENTHMIKPRVEKQKGEQKKRCMEKAEIFTPSWICNAMNNLTDNSWFERENVFNVEGYKSWKATAEKIEFVAEEGKTWQDYVMANKLEITCGEAPFIVSRYDAVTGEEIPLRERIGFLDRKLRVVAENTTDKEEWLKWAFESFKHSYGYDYQGDNVFLARKIFCLLLRSTM